MWEALSQWAVPGAEAKAGAEVEAGAAPEAARIQPLLGRGMEEKEGNSSNEKYYTKITVYDRELKDFIYYKDILTDVPEVDILVSNKRDLRTTTRRRR